MYAHIQLCDPTGTPMYAGLHVGHQGVLAASECLVVPAGAPYVTALATPTVCLVPLAGSNVSAVFNSG